MLSLHYDRRRSKDIGQFWLQVSFCQDPTPISTCQQLGYWCDEKHLRAQIKHLNDRLRVCRETTSEITLTLPLPRKRTWLHEFGGF